MNNRRLSLNIMLTITLLLSSMLFAEKSNTKKANVVALTLTRLIGEKHGDDPEKAILQIASVDTDSKGNYYILDAGRNKVLKYDKDGNYIKFWGRKGVGPGEFYMRAGVLNDKLVVGPNDKVYITNRNYMQIFNTEGEYLNGFKFKAYASFSVDNLGRIYSNKTISEESTHNQRVFNRSGKPVKTFGDPPVNRTIFNLKVHKMFIEAQADAWTAINSDGIYMCYAYYPIIQKYSTEGKLLWERNIPFEKVTNISKEEKSYLKKHYTPRKDKLSNLSDLTNREGLIAVNALMHNDKFYVLIMRDDPPIILEFNSDGDLLREFVPDPFIAARFKDAKTFAFFTINKATGNFLFNSLSGSYLYETVIESNQISIGAKK